MTKDPSGHYGHMLDYIDAHEGEWAMLLNPMFTPGFTYCSMDCGPLAQLAAEAVGMADFYRGRSTYGDGGPSAYTMGFTTTGGKEVFVFSDTTMTEQPTADRMLMFACPDEEAELCIVAKRFSAEFMADLSGSWKKPVHFVLATLRQPFFVKATDADSVPVVHDTCHICNHLLDDHSGAEPCKESR